MDAQHFHSVLSRLSGHLITRTTQQENDIQRLHQSLSRSLLPEDILQLKGSSFVFENSDLFAAERIPSERSAALRAIAEAKATQASEPELRVFLREVPVRSQQLYASVPQWAGGAAVDHTIGPFTNKDGRQFWFDFFRIEKQVALYIQGSADPALLFSVRTRFIFTDLNLPPVTDLLPVYHLPPGSIWINSRLLAANSPSGAFTGLTIKGGTITLSAPPQLINGKLTILPSTVVNVELRLQQPGVPAANPSDPYGIDARNATLRLPHQLHFHFSAQGSAIDLASKAHWKVYGQKASFEWNPQAQPVYESQLHQVLVLFESSPSSFQVSDCQSSFNRIQGQAPVTGSAWGLPVATIDVLHPTPAAGIGAMLVKCGAGLAADWKGLKGGALNLAQPCLLAEPGIIVVSDLGAGNVFCQQKFNLWKDALNPFGSTIQVQFPSASVFFFETLALGFEALMVLVNADAQIDRPVTVSGQSVAVRSKNSVLILGVSQILKMIYLFDDNILADTTDLLHKPPTMPQPIALALENALFKVTPVNGCLLFGQLADDFIKVERGFLFLTFGLYAYLPTLPDPYAADLGYLKFQFRGERTGLTAPIQYGGQTIWMWLVCELQWQPDVNDRDAVKVAFFFAPLQNQFQLMQGTAATVSQTSAVGVNPFAGDFRIEDWLEV